MRRTVLNFSLLTVSCACAVFAVSGAAFLPPVYPGNAGRLGGTLGDGVGEAPFDGIVDARDWTFNGFGGYEGLITLACTAAESCTLFA